LVEDRRKRAALSRVSDIRVVHSSLFPTLFRSLFPGFWCFSSFFAGFFFPFHFWHLNRGNKGINQVTEIHEKRARKGPEKVNCETPACTSFFVPFCFLFYSLFECLMYSSYMESPLPFPDPLVCVLNFSKPYHPYLNCLTSWIPRNRKRE
jgi:hypothetical protein